MLMDLEVLRWLAGQIYQEMGDALSSARSAWLKYRPGDARESKSLSRDAEEVGQGLMLWLRV